MGVRARVRVSRATPVLATPTRVLGSVRRGLRWARAASLPRVHR